MLLFIAPYLFGFLILLTGLASWWLSQWLVGLTGRHPSRRIWSQLLGCFLFLLLLGLPVLLISSYHIFAFERTVRTTVLAARAERTNGPAESERTAPVVWQENYEDASKEAWKRYGESLAPILRILAHKRDWEACAALLADPSTSPPLDVERSYLLSERLLALRALEASDRRDERNYLRLPLAEATARMGLKVYNDDPGLLGGMREYLYLHAGARTPDGPPARSEACRWATALYQKIEETDAEVSASLLSQSLYSKNL